MKHKPAKVPTKRKAKPRRFLEDEDEEREEYIGQPLEKPDVQS
jgi:hypothetical protein